MSGDDPIPPDAESTPADASDDEVAQFVEEVESDPSANPPDEGLKDIKGG